MIQIRFLTIPLLGLSSLLLVSCQEQEVGFYNILAYVLIIFVFGVFIYFYHRSSVRLKKAYHELEIANKRAQELSRMKSDFIQQISHEIRTPLNILSGFTQVLTMSDAKLDEAMRQEIKGKITENTDRITSLVNKMLELSEARSQTVIECYDKVTAVQIVTEAINASGIEKASHLEFDLLIAPDAKDVRIQTNLAAAVREGRPHTPPSDQLQKVVLRLTGLSGRLFFSVEDTGIGIAHKDAERIFDEFVQLDEFYDGTGIGLTVARSLARRIGGDIKVDTAYIGGSRFVMTLPIK